MGLTTLSEERRLGGEERALVRACKAQSQVMTQGLHGLQMVFDWLINCQYKKICRFHMKNVDFWLLVKHAVVWQHHLLEQSSDCPF